MHKIPFKGRLQESDISDSGKLHELEENPNKIIRSESFDLLKSRYKNTLEPIQAAGIVKELYTELEKEYDILVPVEFVAGKNKQGKDAIYSITDRIKGKNLTDSGLEETEELVSEVKKLYESIARYFLDKLDSRGYYLTDINRGSQYVYGTKNGEKSQKIYLVDTDIFMNNNETAIYTIIHSLVVHMTEMENKFDVRFEKAREYLREFSEHIVPGAITEEERIEIEKHISEIERFLQNEKLGPIPNPEIPPFW